MVVESKPSQNACAFAGNNTAFSGATPFRDVNADRSKKFPTGKARIKLLYEEYVHLQQLSRVWNTPVTNPPLLEPLFAAGFHAIELAFLLLAEFLNDSRTYVAKRPRVERVADDIADQCKLLTNLIDGELEEEGSCSGADRLTLTQPFPFPSAPPLAGRPGFSPGLSRFIKAAHAAYGRMSQAEKNSLIKTVLNITSVFHGNFQRWTVGLGLEPQLNELRAAVGLAPLSFCHSVFLDYNALVRPHVAEETLTKERYKYAEDFFFRTVHLGTECWAFIALARLQSAADHALAGHFHVAAARAHQAARILDYLGDHVMLLTQMNLKDYLDLKVELEGTSGEGSAAVKKLRPLVRSLLEPLSKACFDKQISDKSPICDHILEQKEDTAGDDVEDSSEEERLGRALMVVYRCPDRYRDLYNYAKSLEDVESALLHFYYQHFCLAQNVIGSDARGTMRLPVQALKRTYETMVFPVLDRVRSGLGAAIDAERAHVKGKMMDEIIHAYLTSQGDNVAATNAVVSNIDLVRQPSKCPFGFSNDDMTAEAVAEEAKALSLSRVSMHDVASNDTHHASLPKLYSWESTTTRGAASELRKHAAALRLPSHPLHPLGGPLSFLDHAWGQPSPLALQAALAELEGLYLLGNPSWDAVFGSIMPEAASHVARLLDIPEGAATVHFAHNSHELVTRVLSQLLLDRPSYTHACVEKKPLRVLTSDCEFYSVTRQLNRLTEAGAVDVCAVSTKPVESFSDRFISVASTAAAAGQPFDVVYVSQTTYLTQETLLPDVAAFVKDLHQACSGHANAASCDVEDTPLVMVDGYHAFAAFPVSLGPAAERCIYVAGLLKHAGCGANAAFATVPAWMTSGSPTPKLRPVFTGWLADPSVLASGSDGIAHGSYVGYDPAMTLQGATPAFLLPLLTWNHLQRLWAHITPRTLTVEDIHMHVLALQEELLAGLRQHGTHGLTQENLVPPSPERCRSHTLVFQQACSEDAKQVVEQLQAHGILVDCRKQYVRVGIGPNHTSADVRSLCMAVRAIM